MTTVSPELTRNTGGWALSNQPHWVVSSVAGKRCTFFPFGSATVRRFGSGGPIGGTASVGGAAGAGAGCCARMALPVVSQAPPMITPAAANAKSSRRFIVILHPYRNRPLRSCITSPHVLHYFSSNGSASSGGGDIRNTLRIIDIST